MDYKKHYNSLISTRRTRLLLDTVYYERHHILPRCLGGSDEEDNLIYLTPEEHYTAHLLLAKIYNIDKLWYACQMMSTNLPKRNNKLYGWVRRRIRTHRNDTIKNAWAVKRGFDSYEHQATYVWDLYINKGLLTPDISMLLGMGEANVNNCIKYYANENSLVREMLDVRAKHKSEISRRVRNSFTEEQETRRVSARKKTGYSTAQRGEARRGKNNPVYGMKWTKPEATCPHCNKTVRGKRWHFDNCKERK